MTLPRFLAHLTSTPMATEKNDAGDRGSDVTGNADANEAVGHDEDDDRADHRSPDRAATARDRRAADDDSRQRLKFPTDAGGRVRAALSRGVEDAAGGA